MKEEILERGSEESLESEWKGSFENYDEVQFKKDPWARNQTTWVCKRPEGIAKASKNLERDFKN